MSTSPKTKKLKLSEDTITDSDDGNERVGKDLGPSNPTATKLERNSQGEIYFELATNRRITLRKWKGKVLVDIREFWGDSDDLKPGKKGISLTVEQWEELLTIAPEIQKLINNS